MPDKNPDGREIVIKIHNLQKWQERTKYKFKFFVARNFLAHRDFRALVQEDPLTALYLIHLWGEANFETEEIRFSERALRRDMMDCMNITSNRFRHMDKLELMKKHNLIDYSYSGEPMTWLRPTRSIKDESPTVVEEPTPEIQPIKIKAPKRRNPKAVQTTLIPMEEEEPTEKELLQQSAKKLVDELYDFLKKAGVSYKDKATYFKSINSAKEMLKELSEEEVRAGMLWLMEHPKYSVKITSFYSIKMFFADYQRANPKPLADFPKNEKGLFSFNFDTWKDPGDELEIPYEKLCLESRYQRMRKMDLLDPAGAPKIEEIHHPLLRQFVSEYTAEYPQMKVDPAWKEFWEAMP